MALRDILLTLTSYPGPTPASVLADAISVAATLGAQLAALSCEVHVQIPGHLLSGSVANIPGIIAGETEKSRQVREDLCLHSTQPRQRPAFRTRRSWKDARPSKFRNCWSTISAS